MNTTTTAAPAATGTRLPATATADPDVDVLRESARRVPWLSASMVDARCRVSC